MDQSVNQKVVKKSGKPFKSGLKTNTVRGMIIHPIMQPEMAYVFNEDDSYVSVVMCLLV